MVTQIQQTVKKKNDCTPQSPVFRGQFVFHLFLIAGFQSRSCLVAAPAVASPQQNYSVLKINMYAVSISFSGPYLPGYHILLHIS